MRAEANVAMHFSSCALCSDRHKVTTIDLQVVECFGLFVCGGLTLFFYQSED